MLLATVVVAVNVVVIAPSITPLLPLSITLLMYHHFPLPPTTMTTTDDDDESWIDDDDDIKYVTDVKMQMILL